MLRPLATGEYIRREMLGACFHGIAHFLSDPAHGERHALAFDQPVVEPGRPRRRHLAIEVDVRPVGEHEGRSGIVRPTEPTCLGDAARGRRVGKGLDPAQAHGVSAAVGAIDHRIGLAGQFVMQSGGDEAPDDRR